ncbi:uncharacterized protein CCOS01_02176 [Colletotrichum costaricense]|uniref:Uncharacterized protein n=1 Tax=Colletotrichum costaricense TaxID=1209916 RepID=A0AAI9Z7I3_9PEZI|nr:uncharacterized protein CCOS01_02176 [Colletotrichum costaricense]KAK1536856.1 hypothetical protein CCOS01_02176 [Colletotrichum costaricense]
MLTEMKYTRNKARSFTLINRDKVDGSLMYAPVGSSIGYSSCSRWVIWATGTCCFLAYRLCG